MDYKEKVIALLNSQELSKEQKEKLEGIFPELKESEDERIRKSLISFLKSPFVNKNITDEKVTPWIAWLEKQGEQKPDEDRYMEGYLNGMNDTLKTQKPAIWSEEDEKIINELIAVVELYFGIGDDLEKQRCLSWLKSPRLQNVWKPSEEQIEVLQWCIPMWIEPKSKAVLESLLNDLKKLKER